MQCKPDGKKHGDRSALFERAKRLTGIRSSKSSMYTSIEPRRRTLTAHGRWRCRQSRGVSSQCKLFVRPARRGNNVFLNDRVFCRWAARGSLPRFRLDKTLSRASHKLGRAVRAAIALRRGPTTDMAAPAHGVPALRSRSKSRNIYGSSINNRSSSFKAGLQRARAAQTTAVSLLGSWGNFRSDYDNTPKGGVI